VEKNGKRGRRKTGYRKKRRKKNTEGIRINRGRKDGEEREGVEKIDKGEDERQQG
jgi:hypothetical protein